ncbi:MAG: STAS-like domain-containing protein, partial [Lachnospiraceae bacterium]|nr:STAS-like domain-containing protein [Lachnospiraceae bacterium]
NAIDHSEAEDVFLVISQNYLNTTVMIVDNGVGIFRKIKDYYHYTTLDDAIHELFKGKITTDSAHHSGEGIFFTSRILDGFAAISDGKIFTHNKFLERIKDIAENDSLRNLIDGNGTVIFMQLSNFSKKVLKEVFDMFADVDGGFTKTRVPVKNIFEIDPVSRSQAKRLYQRFDRFQEVELDFEGIQEIGQGFAHELFVVFQNAHKDVKLTPVNTSPDIEKMIHHVRQ